MGRDNFKAPLKCPKCGLEGVAEMSQADGWAYVKGDRTTTVEDLPVGFKVVQKQSYYGEIDIFCEADDVSALVRQR